MELKDICATLLDCTGLDVVPEIQSHSLKAALEDDDPPDHEYVFPDSGALKMLRSVRYKLTIRGNHMASSTRIQRRWKICMTGRTAQIFVS